MAHLQSLFKARRLHVHRVFLDVTNVVCSTSMGGGLLAFTTRYFNQSTKMSFSDLKLIFIAVTYEKPGEGRHFFMLRLLLDVLLACGDVPARSEHCCLFLRKGDTVLSRNSKTNYQISWLFYLNLFFF